MALNLSRNSRLFFTTNVNATTGVINDGSHTAGTTFEIQILDGYTFSQNTNTETVTLTEAGASPVRGQRSFNTSLAPVDFSFSTYVRPEKVTNVGCEESVLWGALVNNTANLGFSTVGSSSSIINLDNSNVNQLMKFGLLVVVDQVTYAIDNCAMNQVTLDFGIDQIATLQWSGFGGALRQLTNSITSASTGGTFAGGGTISGTYLAKDTDADYITNKLSNVVLVGSVPTVSSRTLPITGGSFTYNNNITFLTPNNLGIVNTPVAYFTGTRAISGSITAYLKTGDSNDTGNLLSTMLSNTGNTETRFSVTVNVGGANNPKVVLSMPTCSLQIPTVDVQQVVSTTINFTAQGYTSGAFDVAATNELTITYSANT